MIAFVSWVHPASADGYGWHFNTIANYAKFIEFFNDKKGKPLDQSDLDEYYFWNVNEQDSGEEKRRHKKMVDHALSGDVNYGELSFQEAQLLDGIIRYFVTQTDAYEHLRVELEVDSIATRCFGDYLDLRAERSTVTNLFANGRRLNTDYPVQCGANVASLESTLSRLGERENLSDMQRQRIDELEKESSRSQRTCYNSYVALSPTEVGLLAEELEPVVAAADFDEEECPLKGFYEYLRKSEEKKSGIFAWTSD